MTAERDRQRQRRLSDMGEWSCPFCEERYFGGHGAVAFATHVSDDHEVAWGELRPLVDALIVARKPRPIESWYPTKLSVHG